jgi:hypothetical protein
MLLLTGLCGCAESAGTAKTDAIENIEQMPKPAAASEDTIDTADAADTVGSVKVVVDSNGYAPSDEKTAFFLGTQETGKFSVINADTRKEVYQGTLSVDSEQDGKVWLKGKFSAVTDEGTYYIEAEHIGRSYPFTIQDGYFETIAEKLLENVQQGAEDADTAFLDRTQALAWLLRYQEYYGDNTELPDAITEAGNALLEDKPEQMDEAKLAFYCGTMAQLSKTVKAYDAREASLFLREAESTYQLLEGRKQEPDFDEVWLFYDSALLYQVTGYAKYHNVIKNYLSTQDSRDFFAEGATTEELLADEAYVYGAIAYLSTVFRVDTNLCSTLMQALTDKAESMEEEHDQNPFLCVSKEREGRLLADRLYVVTIAEHVIVSREYVRILEDGIHYVNGCNETGMSFLSGMDNTETEQDSDIALEGAYLFILGEIVESEAAE